MRKILLSLGILVVAGALIAGGTGAFFSDEETSTGNTFTAGEIDLKIDNTSYYNGVANPATSWSLVDLTVEKFFDFDDLKPGDWGEDTISLHVGSNDSWVCADVTLTSDDDNGITEPEGEDGDVTDGAGNGELADAVNFLWWADDGDNVLESDENVLPGGPLGALAVGESATVAFADSDDNIWGDEGALPGETTVYVGKAWCFGDIAAAALEQDNLGADSTRTPANSTGGITCSGGADENNVTQTDSLTADITFRAVQSRHNADFQCVPQDGQPEPTTGTLIVEKVIVGSTQDTVEDFSFTIDASLTAGFEADGSNQVSGLSAGPHVVAELPANGYAFLIGGDCDVYGNVTVPAGGSATCTITNTVIPQTPQD